MGGAFALENQSRSMMVLTATDVDIPECLKLARDVSDLFGADMTSDPDFHEHLKRNVARGSAFCVRINGELAGAMTYRNGWIRWLAVFKRFRRQGVGRLLVETVLASGAKEIRVTTFGQEHPHPDAEAARILYRNMGFAASADIPDAAPDDTPREVLLWVGHPGP